MVHIYISQIRKIIESVLFLHHVLRFVRMVVAALDLISVVVLKDGLELIVRSLFVVVVVA